MLTGTGNSELTFAGKHVRKLRAEAHIVGWEGQDTPCGCKCPDHDNRTNCKCEIHGPQVAIYDMRIATAAEDAYVAFFRMFLPTFDEGMFRAYCKDLRAVKAG